MSNPNRNPSELNPRGPEGVPVDAPGNDAPAISPHAVSRMHRAEDDGAAIRNSPDFSDSPAQSSRTGDPRDPGQSQGTGQASDANRGLQAPDDGRREANPGHGTAKDAGTAPKGLGDGEAQEQAWSQDEARQPGADNPKFDE